jgi:transcriptional regulator with XRE-family HTH domain
MKAQHQKYFLTVGKNLLSLREQMGLSQQELANKCNVDRAKISKIENGRVDFMYSTLIEIANALDIDIGELTNLKE